MNILFLSHGHDLRGGAEVVLRDLLFATREKGHSVQCVVPRKRGAFIDALVKEQVKVHHVPYICWLCYQPDVLYKFVDVFTRTNESVDTIVKIIQEEKIDLVVTNTIMMFDGVLAANKCGIPHIWYIHELLSEDPDLLPMAFLKPPHLYPFMFMFSKFVIAISDSVKRELAQYISAEAQKKIRLVYNGVEMEDRGDVPPKRQHNKLVLAAGSIRPRKGYDLLLHAARHVINEIPDAKFMVTGRRNKTYSPALLDLQARLGLSNEQFYFASFKTNMSEVYKQASIFALPSVCEPFGLVIIEAMRAGLPVVSTTCGGPEDIIEDGVTGYLTERYNFAKTLIHVLTHEEEADRIAVAGWESVRKKFTFEQHVDNWLKVLGEI